MERRTGWQAVLLAAFGIAAGVLSLAIVMAQGSVSRASSFRARADLPPFARDAPLSVSSFTVAQWFHDTYDPSRVNKLDADHDGVVCESLP